MSCIPENSDMVVVYEALPALAKQAAAILRKGGIQPIVVEKENQRALYTGHDDTELAQFVSVSVAREEVQWARALLAKWDKTCSQNTAGLSRTVKVQALISGGVTAAIAGLLHICGRLGVGTVLALAGIWALVFALLANAEKSSEHRKKD